ncbi:MAG: alanine--tRNA ligase [Pleurocapsa minor GSE-CHR-MK-17-07R]|jgi:alanyl-tRNA synthetase|nr:alanine--tRNA ligase [Pleurocapsa minor GSE-CHR-MK 17-07R]
MKPMTSAEARQAFLDFFAEMGHKEVASSSLVPGNDPTLLFTNAGMVQFKDVFLGLDKRDYRRATTSQKSMRVSGKHNDLENVGPSPRHHTFFEMLGNFSFGDYFKRDAIKYAYTLLTQVFMLPPERLAFTVYKDDDEAYDIWVNDVGVDPKRVARMGPKTNFWQMAETGPCGPTSEIHWDKTPDLGTDDIIPMMQAEDDRFLELWNLVFMQYNRTQADPDHTGKFDVPLPAPGVDTGMGLERILSVVNGVTSNYDTDLFMPIIRATQALTGHTDEERHANYVPYRVIADHIRAAVFLIADGVLPGAKGRDSVCRLVIRRAARFGSKIGFNEPFLATVADTAIDVMGVHYTDLLERREAIKKVITQEEERFRRTMDRGLEELNAYLAALPDGGMLSGEAAFYLKATLGLPIQVTKDIMEERGYTVDMEGFQAAEDAHALASGGGQAMGTIESSDTYKSLLASLTQSGALPDSGVAYDPYGALTRETTVLAFVQDGQVVTSPIAGDKVEVLLGATPFYVESGGQVSDTGVISGDGWRIEVEDMKKPLGGLVLHVGEVVEGTPQVGAAATAQVDAARRANIIRNHTATHLLHAALRDNLGSQVQQRGSLVAPDRLRFDFVLDAKMSPAAIEKVTRDVNDIILRSYRVNIVNRSLAEARAEGAMALFGEKYGDTVRTVSVVSDDGQSRYSYELCGGVHVKDTSEIGLFLIVSEGSVSAGIRRVEALTGAGALEYVLKSREQLHEAAVRLGALPEQVPARVEALQEELQAARKAQAALQRDLARKQFEVLIGRLETINGRQALIARVDNVPSDTLREMSDWFRGAVPSGVMIIGSVSDGKPQLVAAVTDDLTKQGLHAGNLIKQIAPIIGGGGGGRPTMAQAGGKDVDRLDEALASGRSLISG